MFCKKFSISTVSQASFCVRHGKQADGRPTNYDDNDILIPRVHGDDDRDDGSQRLYICASLYRVVLRLTSADVPLYNQLPSADSGTLCVTLSDKGAGDNISDNPNKYESVYFKKVKGATGGMNIHDNSSGESIRSKQFC